MTTSVSDLVQDARLESTVDGTLVRHTVAASDPATGRRLSKTEELWARKQTLGRGGFGVVWLAECASGRPKGQLRAIKQVTKQQSVDAQIDYSRELEAFAKFSHQKYTHCFVKSYGWFEDDDCIYITMEYFHLGDLSRYTESPLPEREVRLITSQVLEGLVFMHGNGFAHRDLKPTNILVCSPSPQWWVKIGDFGISKRVQSQSTAFRSRIGTEDFVAPEVRGIHTLEDLGTEEDASQEMEYSFSADIWSLGVVTYRLVTGQFPFSSPRALSAYVVMGKSFPSSALTDQQASEETVEVIKQMLGASPTKRPTAKQLSESHWAIDLSPAPEQDEKEASKVPSPHLELTVDSEPAIGVEGSSAQWTTNVIASNPASLINTSTSVSSNETLYVIVTATQRWSLASRFVSTTWPESSQSKEWTLTYGNGEYHVRDIFHEERLVRVVAISPYNEIRPTDFVKRFATFLKHMPSEGRLTGIVIVEKEPGFDGYDHMTRRMICATFGDHLASISSIVVPESVDDAQLKKMIDPWEAICGTRPDVLREDVTVGGHILEKAIRNSHTTRPLLQIQLVEEKVRLRDTETGRSALNELEWYIERRERLVAKYKLSAKQARNAGDGKTAGSFSHSTRLEQANIDECKSTLGGYLEWDKL